MDKSSDYNIEKLEKGPLQRFKNQNLLLKKFGEVGLQVYKVITGKRTTEELRSDLDMDEELYSKIIDYMNEAGMVKLIPVGEEAPKEEEIEAPEEVEEIPEEAEEMAPEIEAEEIKPEEEIMPEGEIAPELEKEELKEEVKEELEEEITPIEEEITPEEFPAEEIESEVEEEAPSQEEGILPELEKEKEAEEEAGEEEAGEIEFGGLGEFEGEEEPEGGPVEKIIKDKYGEIGLKVYTLIDGARTAEEIMEETGLDEEKLVEILDFLDEQGIIKLEYPKGKAEGEAAQVVPKEMPAEEFKPMIEEEAYKKQIITSTSPDLIPAKAPVTIVKSVQLRAKTMLRFSDFGDKIFAAVDGKSDVIDLSLKLNIPLFRVMEVLNFLNAEGGLLLNPVPRTEIRRKYGDDGYNVYKKYRKEGLMLYELIGKEFTIKQMADKITTNKTLVFDMFLFIYEVLGIEMPINKDALKRELGL
jgi:hypothetical protein